MIYLAGDAEALRHVACLSRTKHDAGLSLREHFEILFGVFNFIYDSVLRIIQWGKSLWKHQRAVCCGSKDCASFCVQVAGCTFCEDVVGVCQGSICLDFRTTRAANLSCRERWQH